MHTRNNRRIELDNVFYDVVEEDKLENSAHKTWCYYFVGKTAYQIYCERINKISIIQGSGKG